MNLGITYKISAERTDIDHPYLSPFFFQQQKAYALALKYCKNKRVLEIGSGSGYGADRIASIAKEVIAIDKDKISIDKCKNKFKNENLKFLNTSIEEYYPKEKVDLVISFQVLEHISPKKVKLYLNKISLALNKNGVCIISTPNSKTSSYNENPYHYKEYTAMELKDLLSSYFKTVIIQGVSGDNKVRQFEKTRRKAVISFLAKDKLGIRKLLPRKARQIIFDIATFGIRVLLNKKNIGFKKISEKNYSIVTINLNESIDLIAICKIPIK